MGQKLRLLPWTAGALVLFIFVTTCVLILEITQDNALSISIRKNIAIQLKNIESVLPPAIFDGRINIPKTNISVSYPTMGFNGSGVWFAPYNKDGKAKGATGGIDIMPSSTVSQAKDKKAIEVTVDVRQAKNDKGLGDLVKDLNDRTNSEYVPNGTIETVGDRLFYVAKNIDDDLVTLEAFTRVNDQYVHVEFRYVVVEQSKEQVTSMNEKLFYEYLKKLDIKVS